MSRLFSFVSRSLEGQFRRPLNLVCKGDRANSKLSWAGSKFSIPEHSSRGPCGRATDDVSYLGVLGVAENERQKQQDNGVPNRCRHLIPQSESDDSDEPGCPTLKEWLLAADDRRRASLRMHELHRGSCCLRYAGLRNFRLTHQVKSEPQTRVTETATLLLTLVLRKEFVKGRCMPRNRDNLDCGRDGTSRDERLTRRAICIRSSGCRGNILVGVATPVPLTGPANARSGIGMLDQGRETVDRTWKRVGIGGITEVPRLTEIRWMQWIKVGWASCLALERDPNQNQQQSGRGRDSMVR
ncbi:hypothetical protein CCUS01_15600 [Colletotrichum cuscutae]|uniref:Uncharacterized protein n=1 Tax=Colletotrichum cuscutae TaxID=1209917 RepID=A0AAI9VGN3_9PEZI|nr:hypothetical protein CCUS01_15600 [Colletotrichum cuscutae]